MHSDLESAGQQQSRAIALTSPLPAIIPSSTPPLPAILADAGPSARFAWDEFFSAQISNPHTRALYRRAILRFLNWLEPHGIKLAEVTPGMIGSFFGVHPGSITTKKAELSGLRRFFDLLVTRHVIVLNPALSVRSERHQVIEGLTPEITADQARRLFKSIDIGTLPGLRDRAIVAVLVYTAARAGAVAGLRRKHLQHDGTQFTIRFAEKGGKQREIPVRHDLQEFLLTYIEAAGTGLDHPEAPLFNSLHGRTGRLTDQGITAIDICRMVKRRLKAAALPARLSPHSFRVATVTDLLNQGVPLEDVQYLAGHADPRTTRLYDRRQKRITRNIVERISI